jgi:hypothetical protein
MIGNECHNSLDNEKNHGRGLLFSEKRLGDKYYQEEIDCETLVGRGAAPGEHCGDFGEAAQLAVIPL